MFFYAGHGLQVDGTNFLAPIDARITSEHDLDFEALRLDIILRPMEKESRVSLVFLDACRDNPFLDNLVRSLGVRGGSLERGLARVSNISIGTFIGFATEPGSVALDGDGEHSPFTSAMLDHMDSPGLDVEIMMRRVRDDVVRATQSRQIPWSHSSLLGRGFVFKDVIPEPQPVEPSTADHLLELAYWDSVRDSKTVELLQSYLDQYPNGKFASLAHILIARLDGTQNERVEIKGGPKDGVEHLDEAKESLPKAEDVDGPQENVETEVLHDKKKPARPNPVVNKKKEDLYITKEPRKDNLANTDSAGEVGLELELNGPKPQVPPRPNTKTDASLKTPTTPITPEMPASPDARDGPNMSEQCTRDLTKWRRERPGNAAFAVATNGACGASWGFETGAEAVSRALGECGKYGTNCKIVATKKRSPVATKRVTRPTRAGNANLTWEQAYELCKKRINWGGMDVIPKKRGNEWLCFYRY